jgi:protein-tyrosine phosphatase
LLLVEPMARHWDSFRLGHVVIDLHCHILPGIDDGARDLDDAIAMAAQAEGDGIETICATPHIRHDHDVRIAELPERTASLNHELTSRGIRVRVAAGGEVSETAVDGLDGDELSSVALGNGCWILLEPRPGPLSSSLLAAADRLFRAGFRALVAHPERHLGADAIEILTQLIRHGALVQGTAALVELDAGSHLADLAGRGLIHVLGSDSHSAHIGRPVRLSEGLAAISRIPAIQPHATWIAEVAPAAILAGEMTTPPFAPG